MKLHSIGVLPAGEAAQNTGRVFSKRLTLSSLNALCLLQQVARLRGISGVIDGIQLLISSNQVIPLGAP